MMKNCYLIVLFVLCSLPLLGQKISHKVSMPAPETHYFHIETVLEDFKQEKIVLAMPVWSPGSYLVREYSKNVNQVRAKDEKGNELEVRKVRKNQWEIDKGKAKKVVVNYEYYAFELTVRTSFLDLTHGYFNGTNLFTYPIGYENLGGRLTVVPHSSFKKIASPLQKHPEGIAGDGNEYHYIFENFDQLADAPFEIGNHEEFSFDAAGVKHHVAMYGHGNYDVEQLKIDMAKIIEAETKVFGENPNKEYWFIIHNVEDGSGGLEHMNSTTLSVNRWTYSPENYNNFLSLVAHEYFHVWNVKRLRPSSLIPYDYNQENYTDLLWEMEGFTSYYDKLILRRAGFLTKQEYLNRYKGGVNWIEGSIGNSVQSVSESSFDAWIKAYMPNENSGNTTISYYSKGGIIAGLFDAMIIKNTNGKNSLDDFMRKMYTEFYKKKNSGITQESMRLLLEEFVGERLDSFFEKYINGTQTIPYQEIFSPIGIDVAKYEGMYQELGVSTSTEGGRLIISSVKAGSAAEKSGLSPKDEIIALNGFRVNQSKFEKFLDMLNEGEEFNLIISRDEKLMAISAKIGIVTKPRYEFSYNQGKLSDFWLRQTVE